jgi:hypothetical protein
MELSCITAKPRGSAALLASLLILTGCIILPRSGESAKPETREKTVKYDKAAIITALEPILVKDGFTIRARDAGRGYLLASKSGRIDSDYGYYRWQKYCLFWGYASFGTIELEARAVGKAPRDTYLTMTVRPNVSGAGKLLDKTMEDLDLKLFLQEKQ